MTKPQGQRNGSSGGPSPPQPAVPPPSTVNIEYNSLGTTPAGGRDNYFPARNQSQEDLPPKESTSETGPPTFPQPSSTGAHTNDRESHSSVESQKDVKQPGATEALREKLAEHRKSMSAAYNDEHPSRARDFALEARENPPLVRGATFDQTISGASNSKSIPQGGHRLLQKSHSIMTPQRHTPDPVPPLPSAPIPSTSSEVPPPVPHSAIPSPITEAPVPKEHQLPGKIPDIVTSVDPSTTKKPTVDGQPVPKAEIQEAAVNPKKPFYKRGFGTKRRLLGTGQPSSSPKVGAGLLGASAGTRPSLRPNGAGTASTAAITGGPSSASAADFSLAGAHKPSMARQRTKPAAPVGVAIPNMQRRREPTWSKKARERPLYSLGKPLPTHEEVQAQRAWQEQIERIKKMYPEADPPEPPPLPSQQAASAIGGGLQIDQAQLKDIIRSAIQEYKRYEAGELDLDAVSAVSPRSPSMAASGRNRRSTVMSKSSAASAGRNRIPSVTLGARNFGLPRMDSSVIDEEDGPPLQPIRNNVSGSLSEGDSGRRPSKADSVIGGLPAVAEGQGQPLHRASVLSHSQGGKHDSVHRSSRAGKGSMSNASEVGMPAFAEEHRQDRKISHETEPEAGSATDGGHSIGGNSVYSRDHETEGNWSEEEATETDPDEHPGAQARAEEEAAELEAEQEEQDEEEDDDEYPNFIARWRVYAREPFAEFLGAFVLSVIGVGASAQSALSANPNIQPSGTGAAATSVNLSAPLAWGAGVAMSVYIAGGISGGHISPAITIVLAVFRGFPWKRVPSYIVGQLLGFIAGSGVAYGLYRHAITIYEGGPGIRTIGVNGTASFFATYPLEYVSNANAFFQEFVNVALLLILILAIGDADNVPPPAGLNPIIIMFMVMAIGLSLGLQSAYCLNPARDLGPRLVSWWAGYGVGVWDYRDQYWLWCPWVADITGGLFGAFMYDTLIFMGRESPMNKKWHTPFISKTKKTEQLSRDWQGFKLHQKARRAGWMSRIAPGKESMSEAKEKEIV